jgi:multiple sugar transport system substrate-binding protein
VKQKSLLWIFLLSFALWLLAACSNFPTLQPTATLEPTAFVPTPTMVSVESTDTINAPITLVVWILPQFDTTDGSEVSALLLNRLESYADSHPGFRVMVRLKAETGPASLLQSLHATSQAAPLALPDLVVLSTDDMANAADTALIYPFPEGYPAEEDLDWYDAAGQLGTYDNQRFGMPFAADALVMVYKPTQVEAVPTSWLEILDSGFILSHPAADPSAKFSLACYLSSGGGLTGESGGVSIEQIELSEVLNFYADAAEANVMPYWLTQYNTDELAWPTFAEGSAELAITWVSRYFREVSDNIRAAPLPTQNGAPYTLINGWVWAIATPDPNRQVAAAELATYLSAAEFTGELTQAAGYLPLRPSALASWPQGQLQALGSQLLPVADAFPYPSTVVRISPPISQAVISILKGELTAQDALAQVLSAVGQ